MVDTRDYRTKRQKIEALRDKATTPGEKAAAQAALDRLGPAPAAPRRAPSREVPGSSYARARTTTASTSTNHTWNADSFRTEFWGEFDNEPYTPPEGTEREPAGRQAGSSAWWTDMRDAWFAQMGRDTRAWEASEERERLRQAKQREENLRRYGFTMPGDSTFESEYTSEAAKAQAQFNKLKDQLNSDPQFKAAIDELMNRMARGMSYDDVLRAARNRANEMGDD